MNDRQCQLCGSRYEVEKHHVLGRIGPNKDNEENTLDLCHKCHTIWHTYRTEKIEDRIYEIMKSRFGDKFPIEYHGRPYYTKWLIKAEQRAEQRRKENQ